MKNIGKTACTLALMGGAVSQASVVLIDDDFSTSAIDSSSRFQSADIDSGDWNERTAATWDITSGELVNTGTVDHGAFLLNTVSSLDTSLTQVTVSFDYTVGAGSTLYFHSALYTGPNITTGNMSRTTRTGGAYFATGTDFNANFTSALNLKNGADVTGNTGGALISLAGSTSGTFSQTYDISGYTGVSSIADVSHILAAFAIDGAAAGDGAVAIDNVNITAIPEPSSIALIGLGGLALLLRRRK